MRDYRALFVALMMLLVAGLPLAAAQEGWRDRGTWEPDTPEDESDGYMWSGPDTNPNTGVRKIYFNGYRTQAETSYNPNLAATGSRHQWFGETQFVGLLGVWKDCNDDGYIGASEYGLQEYRAELLLDASICKPTEPGSCAGGCPTGYIYPHNDGTWVRELLWIGDKFTLSGGPISANPTYFSAPGTAVWGTFGRPGDEPDTVCPITGNLHTANTGALLDWADCFTGYAVLQALNEVQDDTGAPVGGWTIGDADSSENTLNMANPVHPMLYGTGDEPGEPGDGHNGGIFQRDDHPNKAPRAYRVFDCDGAGQTVTDPTGRTLSGQQGVKAPVVDDPTTSGDDNLIAPITTYDGYLLDTVEIFDDDGKREVIQPFLGVPSTDGSFYEGANETYNVATTGECYPYSHPAPYPYLEGGTDSTNAAVGRKQADLNFIFSAGSRQKIGQDFMGKNWPADLGLAPNRQLDTVGSAWRENRNFLTLPQFVNRNELSTSEAQYQTFYARVGSTAFDVGMQTPQGGAASVFGVENCASIGPGAGVQKGWNCDPDVWIEDCASDGSTADPCALVGQAYHMRDIDCEDGALVRGVPVYLSSAAVSVACVDPATGTN